MMEEFSDELRGGMEAAEGNSAAAVLADPDSKAALAKGNSKSAVLAESAALGGMEEVP